MKTAALILLLSQLAFVSADERHVVKLHDANFAEKTEGKSIFIKFFAPWCEVCQEMAPEYEKLAEEWAGHPNGMIVEMDCEAEDSFGTCYNDPFNVEEYPTVWYGDPKNPKRYTGARDYDTMSAFAIEHLGMPPCSVKRPEFCNEHEMDTIRELQNQSRGELEKAEVEVSRRLADARKEYDAVIEELNTMYESVARDLRIELDDIRSETNHMWMLQIIKQRDNGPRGAEQLL